MGEVIRIEFRKAPDKAQEAEAVDEPWWVEMAKCCIDNAPLRGREDDFLANVTVMTRQPSTRQAAWMMMIMARQVPARR